MTRVLRLYRLALKLYPRAFRARFALEMEEVFRAGLQEAQERHALLGYLLREALCLPGSLVDVHVWFMRAGEGQRMAISSTGGGGMVGVPGEAEGWGASFLAGLPNLLMGILIVSSTLISEIKGIDGNTLGNVQSAAMGVVLLGVLVFSIARGWQRWSASWLVYMFLFAVVLLGLATNRLASGLTGSDEWVSNVQELLFPLAVAYLLYKIACVDRLRALLAAVPPMAFLWSVFQEFVPALPRALAWGWLSLLAFGASVMIFRTRRLTAALALALLVPALGGLPFAYLGVYMGGTLPFTEPGPSLAEVWRQYLPFLAAVLSLALGPQLAAILRGIARGHAAPVGKVLYRLVLGGVLLGLVLLLLQWTTLSSGTPRWVQTVVAARQVWLAAAVLLYLGGFVALLWKVLFNAVRSGEYPAVLWLAALLLLLPGVPLVLFLALPISVLGVPTYAGPWPAVEIIWVFAAAWVAARQKPSLDLDRALPAPDQPALPG
jgi:hypothetical protein